MKRRTAGRLGTRESASDSGPVQKRPIQAEHTDPTLQHPRCVFQILKKHYSRYTPDMVEEVSGVRPELLNKVAETLCRNSGRERTAAFCYAVGWTQHTTGVQFIRAAAIIQLLLGNMRRPGGGTLALRGHASIQGSTDSQLCTISCPGTCASRGPHTTRISKPMSASTNRRRAGGANFASTLSRY